MILLAIKVSSLDATSATPMNPVQSHTRRFYDNFQVAIPQYLQELEGPPPMCLFDFSDPGTQTETYVKSLHDQVVRPVPRSRRQGVLASYYLLGRVLSFLGSRATLKMLRKWTTYGKARHMNRVALRTYELFTISGPEYIFASSISSSLLQE